MAGVRDPAFWRRFSMAVHMDEEKADLKSTSESAPSASSVHHHPEKSQNDDWLENTRKKSRRSQKIGCIIALLVLSVILVVVCFFLWLAKVGPFAHLPF